MPAFVSAESTFLGPKMRFLKRLSLIMTSSRGHQPPFSTHHGVVVNRAKFDACVSSTFRGVKIDTQTN